MSAGKQQVKAENRKQIKGVGRGRKNRREIYKASSKAVKNRKRDIAKKLLHAMQRFVKKPQSGWGKQVVQLEVALKRLS